MVEALATLRDSVAHSWIRRSWKREVATLLLLVWALPTLYLFIMASVDRMNAAGGLYSIMTTAVFTFALGAFGLDAWFKQGGTLTSMPKAGPPSTPPVGVP